MSSSLTALPRIMVAPNGARRTKADHPALPITIPEMVETARLCQLAGADGLHAHVRDKEGNHTLDAGLYRELLAELKRVVPDLYVQITTEAVGQFSPKEQRAVVTEVMPDAVSISIREMTSEGETTEIKRFYHEQHERNADIQHIIYSKEDLALLRDLCDRSVIPSDALQLLFVLGRYTTGQISTPEDLDPFVEAADLWQTATETKLDWACCAFGQRETKCLTRALSKGGKTRIGFENNLYNADGSLAANNADRVTDLLRACQSDSNSL